MCIKKLLNTKEKEYKKHIMERNNEIQNLWPIRICKKQQKKGGGAYNIYFRSEKECIVVKTKFIR